MCSLGLLHQILGFGQKRIGLFRFLQSFVVGNHGLQLVVQRIIRGAGSLNGLLAVQRNKTNGVNQLLYRIGQSQISCLGLDQFLVVTHQLLLVLRQVFIGGTGRTQSLLAVGRHRTDGINQLFHVLHSGKCNVDLRRGNFLFGLDEGRMVLANGIRHKHAVDVCTQLSGVGIELQLIDTNGAIGGTGHSFVHIEPVHLGRGQVLLIHIHRDFVFRVVCVSAQVLPVGRISQNISLLCRRHGQEILIGDTGLRIENLQAAAHRDVLRSLGAGVQGMPLAHNGRLIQGKAQPAGGSTGTPLGGGQAVKQLLRSFGVRAASGSCQRRGIQGHIGGIIQYAQRGSFHFRHIRAALGIGDGHRDALGRRNLLGHIAGINPVGIRQVAQQIAASRMGGGVAFRQQIQQLIGRAVGNDLQILHRIPLCGRLLSAVGEAFFRYQITVYRKPAVIVAGVGAGDSHILGPGSFRHLQRSRIGGNAGQLGNLLIDLSVHGNRHGKLSQVVIPSIRAVRIRNRDVGQEAFAAEGEIQRTAAPRVQIAAAHLRSLLTNLVRHLMGGKIIGNSSLQLPLRRVVGQVQLGVLPIPAVNVGIAGGVCRDNGLHCTVGQIKIVQPGQLRNIQLRRLRAGQIQILQIDTGGQIHRFRLSVLHREGLQRRAAGEIHHGHVGPVQLQGLQGAAAGKGHRQVGILLQLHGNQARAAGEVQRLQIPGDHGRGQLLNRRTGQVQVGQAGDKRQTGQVAYLQAGAIQASGVFHQLAQGGADLLPNRLQQGGVGDIFLIDFPVYIHRLSVHKQIGHRSRDVSVIVRQGHHQSGDVIGQALEAGPVVIGLAVALLTSGVGGGRRSAAFRGIGQLQGVPIRTGNRRGQLVVGHGRIIGDAVAVVQLPVVGLDRAALRGNGQDEGFAVGVGAGRYRNLHRGLACSRRGRVGLSVHGHVQGELGCSSRIGGGPGNAYHPVSRLHLHIGNRLAVIIGHRSGLALAAVGADGGHFHRHFSVGIVEILNIVDLVVNTAHIHFHTVQNGIDIVLLDGVIIAQIPGDYHLVGIVGLVNRQTGRCIRGQISAGGIVNAANMHLIVVGRPLEVQPYDSYLLAGKRRQVHRGGDPAVGYLRRIFQRNVRHGIGIVLGVDVLGKHQSQAHGHIVGRGLLEGHLHLRLSRNFQIGLVQMHVVVCIHLAVNSQRGAALIGIHQIEIKFAVGEISLLLAFRPGTGQRLLVLGSVVIFRLQLRARRFKPELPGGQNVLNVDIGPFMLVGDHSIFRIDQAVAGVEVGIEGIAGYHRPLGDHAGNAGHAVAAHAHL